MLRERPNPVRNPLSRFLANKNARDEYAWLKPWRAQDIKRAPAASATLLLEASGDGLKWSTIDLGQLTGTTVAFGHGEPHNEPPENLRRLM